jgi:predicted transcriptional regulator
MDEELKRFLDEAAEQRQRVRDRLLDNEALRKLHALRERQQTESLGRWVINKCLINGLGFNR